MTATALRSLIALVCAVSLATPALAEQSPQEEQQHLEELRNTVVNLLQALVERGVITREQAEAMVKAAQEKAGADAAAAAAQRQQREKEEANAVRVPYVPQVVKDEIKKEVAQQMVPEVTQQVVSQAKSEGWGVPAALPEWLHRITWSGDARVRGEADVYSKNNAPFGYYNYNAINAAGGISKAGDQAYLDTLVSRYYPLVRLRLNMNADLGGGWLSGARISTGTLVNPDSLNQVEGQYGGRYTTDVDLAYLGWSNRAVLPRNGVSIWAGKFENPFFYSDLLWMPDVTFEGLAIDYRLRLAGSPQAPFSWYLTTAAVPEQDVPLTLGYGSSSNNKWLYAGQTGLDWQFEKGSRIRFGIGYYYFDHIAGVLNAFQSDTTNYTAPPYVQKGNTMFDIANTGDPATTNLFALAADFHELDAILGADWVLSPRYRLSFFADYVKNLGYKEAAVSARVGSPVAPRIQGYESMLSLGSPRLDHAGAWETFVGYRYIQRDAVVDAFTDQDYHLGGTDTKGYILGARVNFTDRVYARLRYMPFDAIDGPPLTIDVWQLELLGSF